MGAKESNIKEYSQEGLRDFHSNFTFLKVEEDPRLGKIHLFTEKTSGKHIGLFNKACPDAQKLEKLRNQLHDRISMDHVNILKIVGYVVKSQENICGTSDVFTVFVEWYEHDLELEIVERATRSEHFKESEMWYMANSLISACSYMEENNVYHGDLRPLNIFMNEEGKIFLADHFFIHPLIDNWGKALNKSKDVFLDPAQLNELKNNHDSPFYDVFKADAFSMGMSLLYAGLLENPIRAYNWRKCEIESGVLDSYLNKFGQIYSPQLLALVASMLELNELKRPTFTQLQEYMSINTPFSQRGRDTPVKQFPSIANYSGEQYQTQSYNPFPQQGTVNNFQTVPNLGNQTSGYGNQKRVFPTVPMINSTYVPQNQSVAGRYARPM